MPELTIDAESPRADDIVELLQAHLEFARATSPPDHVHALDLEGLNAADISFFAARRSGQLLAVGAIRWLGDGRAEVKSMHAAAAARGQGIGRRMLEHLLAVARSTGCTWVGLETGTMEAFAPARHLYESVGFSVCPAFGAYTDNPYSVCMELEL